MNGEAKTETPSAPEPESNEELFQRIEKLAADLRFFNDGFIKALFLLGGGALTISLGIFMRSDAPALSPSAVENLKDAWNALSMSLAIALACWFLLYQQGLWLHFRLAQQYKDNRGRKFGAAYKAVTWLRRLLEWFAIVALLVGVVDLSQVASSVVSRKTDQKGISLDAQLPRIGAVAPGKASPEMNTPDAGEKDAARPATH